MAGADPQVRANAEIAERRAAAPSRQRTRRSQRPDLLAQLVGFFGTWRGDLVAALLLFAFAVAVRLPYLHLVPHYTDEIGENIYAARIARGEIFPLTARDPYFGPLHSYILAGVMRLFGTAPEVPRIVILLFGALTVVATYFLGRAMAGRAVGFLAAALLATSAQHIIVNSHVAWQNATMPLYSTLCFLGLVRVSALLQPTDNQTPATRARRWLIGWLLFAGFCFGLTLHTHPGMIVLAPVLVLAVLAAVWFARAWWLLRSSWPYAAALAGLLAYAPMVIYNVRTGFSGFYSATGRRDYAYETNPTLESYRTNAANFVSQLVRMLSDPTHIPQGFAGYLTPHAAIAVIVTAAGLVLLARRRQILPLLALVITAIVMPRFLRAYGQESDYVMLYARYVTYLLPLLLIASATTLVTATTWLLGRLDPAQTARRRGRPNLVAAFAPPLALVLIACFVAWPLVPLTRFYRETLAIDPNNLSYTATVATVRELRGARTPLLLDTSVANVFTPEGVHTLFALTYFLDLEGIPYRLVEDPEKEWQRLAPTLDPRDQEALPLLITLRDRCWPIRERVPLQRVSDRFRLRNFYRGIPSYYAIYRYVPNQPTAGCFSPGGPQEGD